MNKHDAYEVLNEVLNEVSDVIEEYAKCDNGTHRSGLECARRIIRSHMTDIPESNTRKNGWIPVTERLPAWEWRYLVTFGNPKKVGLAGYGTCQRDIFGKEIGFGWHDLHEAEYFSRDAVIAWMPLPEPYREEREDCETE